jgi:DNA-directed RNA polymerase subunit RPC12/RpoP
MVTKEKQRLLQAAQQSLAAFIQAHPDHLDELFRYTDTAIREAAMADTKQLSLHDAGLLCDRAAYLSKTRIVHRNYEAPRCGGKIIYTEKDAHAKSNKIWSQGRGRMRVYHCPYCNGHHLTHTIHKDSDRQVA